MSDRPGGDASDFSARLQAAVRQAKGKTARPDPAATEPVAVATPSDDFNDRLSVAMQQARGETDSTSGEGETVGGGPVGAGEYIVRDGESLPSIAKDRGFFWETIWNDPANQELKDIRKNPNVLLPDDRLTIREKQRKDESLSPEQRHRFRRRGEPSQLNVCIKVADVPIANTPYTLTVDGEAYPDGITDAAGNVSVPIPGNAEKAVLLVGEPGEETEYVFQIGGTKPMTELAGVQQRLFNLGFHPIELDGELGALTQEALRRFQKRNELPVTGEPDTATTQQLEQIHGS